jgi:DNA-binding GntR family transcriptional regulator
VNDTKSTWPGVQRIQRGPLREQARGQIKQLILTNRLRPGQTIVIDRLANELGVSHTPVWEALAMLEHNGLVMMRPYGNPRVAEIDASDVHEVWEMRFLLEGWAASKAALTLSEDELDSIEDMLACARQDAERSRYEVHLQSDIALHEMILRSVDNQLFQRLARVVNDQSVRIRSLVEAIASADEVLTIVNEHCALMKALRSRDPELARQRLISHLEAGMERTLAALEAMQAGNERV